MQKTDPRAVRSHQRTPKHFLVATSLTAVVFSLLVFAGCFSGQSSTDRTIRTEGFSNRSAAGIMESDTSYITIGDSITVSVWGFPEFNTRSVVRANGTISLPLIGEHIAAGLRKDMLVQQLKEKLSEYIKGEAKVALEITHPLPHITVLGAVAHPGSIPAYVDVPLLEVIANAGGWTELADLRFVKINRIPTSTMEGGIIEIDLLRSIEHGGIRGIPMIRPGDVVIVPSKQNLVSDLSEFLRDAILLFGVFKVFY